LAAIVREGLENSVERHQRNAKILYKQLEDAGFKLFVEDEVIFYGFTRSYIFQKLRLPCLTTVRVPDGVDWKAVIGNLMQNGYEIAGGLGATTGKIWRIGTFGLNSSPNRFSELPQLLKRAAKL
jgi:alanine-glyoxylate transaminase/serine-glyoxylate transaminase/serine-pyruvate transaminase